jgi:hypothetical protein
MLAKVSSIASTGKKKLKNGMGVRSQARRCEQRVGVKKECYPVPHTLPYPSSRRGVPEEVAQAVRYPSAGRGEGREPNASPWGEIDAVNRKSAERAKLSKACGMIGPIEFYTYTIPHSIMFADPLFGF